MGRDALHILAHHGPGLGFPLFQHGCWGRPPYLGRGEEGHGKLQQSRHLDLHRGQ